MKIYSQIKSPADPPPPPGEPSRQSQFSFHQSNSDLPRSQLSDASLRNQKNKFSFRLQPELYFQQNNTQKDKLYQATNHIRLAESSSQQSLKGLAQQPKSSLNRKKIFDESMRITVLNEVGEEVQKVESKVRPTIEESHQPTKKVQTESKPLVSILKKNIQPEQPVSVDNNSSFQRSREKSRKSIQRVQFVHEDTDKYLTKPILQEPTWQPSIKKQQNISLDYSKNYSNLTDKIEKNQRNLIELSQKLEKKITEDEKRNEYFLRLLSQNNQKAHQKQLQLQNYERQRGRFAHQKVVQRQRINLEIQQTKRLQQLILQNRHLCAKVLEQSSQNPQVGPTPEEAQIQQRIRELQSMRQNHTLNQSQSFPLNDSITPSHHLNTTTQSNGLANQQWRQPQVGHSTLTVKPSQQPNFPTFQMIPQRDTPEGTNVTQIKRIVLVSKIY